MKYCISFFAACVLVFSSCTYADSAPAKNRYIIFVDAGSTGSRLHLFKYDDVNIKKIPRIEDVFNESVKPGLSSFSDTPEAAGPSLKKLFDDANSYLNKNQTSLQKTPVHIFATAGMRLLPEAKQKGIYKQISDYLVNNYQVKYLDVRTITGQMEGVYGWLDVNYLLGNFQKNQKTVGSIDMGGASTQIAFESADDPSSKDLVYFIVNMHQYAIFSKTFLGLGQDQALASMIKTPQAAACFPTNYQYADKKLGHFNLNDCAPIYQNLIESHQVSKQLLPNDGETFVAYSGIYYTYDFLQALQTPDRAAFESKINQVCSKDWEKLKQEYPQIGDKYLSVYCANASYHDTLLYDTYQLQGQQLKVMNKINSTDIDWTLGAAFYTIIENNPI